MIHSKLHSATSHTTGGAARNPLNRAAAPTPHEQLVKQTEKWVSQTFFGTLLKQMHDSPFKSQLLDGGRGGQAFSPLMDQHLADHMGRAAGSKLVNSLVRKIEAKNAYTKASKSSDLSNKTPRPPRMTQGYTPARPTREGR